MNSNNTYIIYGSLWNFDCASKKDVFNLKDFSIRRFSRTSINPDFQKLINSGSLSTSEVNFLATLLHLYQSQPNRDFPHFIIKSELKFEKDFDFSVADKKIKWLITSLRLYKNGDVQGRYLSALPKKDYRPEMLPLDFDSYQGVQNKFMLDSIQDFEKFVGGLGGLEELIDTIAVDRFNISFNHYNSPRERLLDLITALESLFNKSPYDVKFKIALRTSHLLFPKKSSETQKTYEFLISAYNLRNRIVHGLGEVDAEGLIDTTSRLTNVLRDVLKKVIILRNKGIIDLFKKSNDNFEKEIDKVILNT